MLTLFYDFSKFLCIFWKLYYHFFSVTSHIYCQALKCREQEYDLLEFSVQKYWLLAILFMLTVVPQRLSVVCCRSKIVDARWVVGGSRRSVIVLVTLSSSWFIADLSSIITITLTPSTTNFESIGTGVERPCLGRWTVLFTDYNQAFPL